MTTQAVLATIDSRKQAILQIVPKSFEGALTWESIRNGIGLAVSRSEKLQKCAPVTIYQAVLDILRLGLDPFGAQLLHVAAGLLGVARRLDEHAAQARVMARSGCGAGPSPGCTCPGSPS